MTADQLMSYTYYKAMKQTHRGAAAGIPAFDSLCAVGTAPSIVALSNYLLSPATAASPAGFCPVRTKDRR